VLLLRPAHKKTRRRNRKERGDPKGKRGIGSEKKKERLCREVRGDSSQREREKYGEFLTAAKKKKKKADLLRIRAVPVARGGNFAASERKDRILISPSWEKGRRNVHRDSRRRSRALPEEREYPQRKTNRGSDMVNENFGEKRESPPTSSIGKRDGGRRAGGRKKNNCTYSSNLSSRGKKRARDFYSFLRRGKG